MAILDDISSKLQDGEDEAVPKLVEQALAEKLAPKDILDKGLIAGMNVIGEKFRDHDIFLPDVLLAAKAMIAGLDIIKPLLAGEGAPRIGKVVIGSVQGDLHDIGKNLVGVMLKGAGFEVIDLGSDVSPERFVAAAESENAEFIGLSALLTTTMPIMKEVVALKKKKGLASRVIVGGAPVNEEFAKEIGADLYAYDAASAVERVKAASSAAA